MSASVNRVTIIGNLGADPELRYTPSGAVPVCSLRIATSEVYKDKTGQKHESVEWHRVTVWGAQAEACNKYLAKGRSVYVEGKLQTRSWDDKEGNKRYSTDVVAERVQFLGGGDKGERTGGGKWGGTPDHETNGTPDPGPSAVDNDDIPF